MAGSRGHRGNRASAAPVPPLLGVLGHGTQVCGPLPCGGVPTVPLSHSVVLLLGRWDTWDRGAGAQVEAALRADEPARVHEAGEVAAGVGADLLLHLGGSDTIRVLTDQTEDLGAAVTDPCCGTVLCGYRGSGSGRGQPSPRGSRITRGGRTGRFCSGVGCRSRRTTGRGILP